MVILPVACGSRQKEVHNGLRIPIAFPPTFGDLDLYLVTEGHYGLYRKLGAHPAAFEGIKSAVFAVRPRMPAGVSFAGYRPHDALSLRIRECGNFSYQTLAWEPGKFEI